MEDYQPPRLAPMDIADLLDAAIRLYRRNFGVFLGIIAAVYVPMGVVQVVFTYLLARSMTRMPENPNEIPWQHMLTIGMGGMGLLLINLLAVPLAQGALAIAISRRYLNQPVTAVEAYAAIGSRWPTLVGMVLLTSLAAGAGMLFCLVPGLYLAIMWLFVTPAIAIEGLVGVKALERSWELVRGQWWRCFGTYLLLSLLVMIVSGAVTWPAQAIFALLFIESNPALAQAGSGAVGVGVSVLLQPVVLTGLVLLYYDMRIRKEGFDLALLAEALKVEVPAAPAPLWSGPPPPPLAPSENLTPPPPPPPPPSEP